MFDVAFEGQGQEGAGVVSATDIKVRTAQLQASYASITTCYPLRSNFHKSVFLCLKLDMQRVPMYTAHIAVTYAVENRKECIVLE